jgi:hypothetical protein
MTGHASDRRNPSHEAPLEFLGVQHGQNIAEVIVGGGSMFKGPESPQKVELLLAEKRDIGHGLRTG